MYFGKEQAALGGDWWTGSTILAFWRAAPLLLRLRGAAQTGVFSTVWKLFPSLTPSCLSPLVAHHAVPMQRDGMGGGHPLRLCHFQ